MSWINKNDNTDDNLLISSYNKTAFDQVKFKKRILSFPVILTWGFINM